MPIPRIPERAGQPFSVGNKEQWVPNAQASLAAILFRADRTTRWNGPVTKKLKNDPVSIPGGHFLRRTGALDELAPILECSLRGDMFGWSGTAL